MAYLISLVFSLVYYGATIVYPAYQVYNANKENRIERIYVLYFFIFGLVSILENTFLFPVKALLGLLSCKLWNLVKLLLAVWLQHPTYRGALLLEQIGGKFLDLGHSKAYPAVGKFMILLGYPDRS